MAAVSRNTPRNYDPAVDPLFADIPAKVSTTFYEGAALSDDGGNGEADALAVSETFLGFCEQYVVSNATTSDINVRVRQQGIIKGLAVTGLDADTDLGVAVYATSSGDFTMTSSSTHVQIGKVVGYRGVSGFGDVFFQGAQVRSV